MKLEPIEPSHGRFEFLRETFVDFVAPFPLDIAYSKSGAVRKFERDIGCDYSENLHKSLKKYGSKEWEFVYRFNEVSIGGKLRKIFGMICFNVSVEIFPISVPGEEAKESKWN